jgi:hypothetical protein
MDGIFGYAFGNQLAMDSSMVSSPFLASPWTLYTLLGKAYVTLAPDMGEKYQSTLKLALCDSWPLSYLVFEEARSFDSSSLQ